MTQNAPTALPGVEAAYPRVRSGPVPRVPCHCSPATPSLAANGSAATAGRNNRSRVPVARIASLYRRCPPGGP